jgi:hypothetical protein
MIGGAVVALALDSLSSSSLGLAGLQNVGPFPFDLNSTGSFSGLGVGTGSMDGIAEGLLALGLITGALIVFGGILINSEIPGRRKAGGILVVVMIIVGGLTTLGGLVIGFILAAIGAYLGLTYRSNSRMVIGLGPVGTLTLGPQGGPMSSTPAGTGPLSYCIKCGSQIRPGAVFCGACGARIGE